MVFRSKDKRGHSVGDLKARNLALVGKWLWRFPLEQNSLWHTVMKSKYGLQSNDGMLMGLKGEVPDALGNLYLRMYLDFLLMSVLL